MFFELENLSRDVARLAPSMSGPQLADQLRASRQGDPGQKQLHLDDDLPTGGLASGDTTGSQCPSNGFAPPDGRSPHGLVWNRPPWEILLSPSKISGRDAQAPMTARSPAPSITSRFAATPTHRDHTHGSTLLGVGTGGWEHGHGATHLPNRREGARARQVGE